jgi:hypothetical protein
LVLSSALASIRGIDLVGFRIAVGEMLVPLGPKDRRASSFSKRQLAHAEQKWVFRIWKLIFVSLGVSPGAAAC